MKRAYSIATALMLSTICLFLIGMSLSPVTVSAQTSADPEPDTIIAFPNAPESDPAEASGGNVAISKASEVNDGFVTYTLSLTNTGSVAADISTIDNFPEGYIPTDCTVTLYDTNGQVYGPFPVQPKQDFHPTVENVPPGASFDLICGGPVMAFIDVSKTPDTQTVNSGDDASFTITVTNTGDVTLNNVATLDPMVAACDASIGALAPGQSTTYTCTDTGVTADYTNEVMAEGMVDLVNTASAGISGTSNFVDSNTVNDTITVDDSDSAFVDVSGVVTNPTDLDISKASVLNGSTLTYTVSVTNTGDVSATIANIDNFPTGYIPNDCNLVMTLPNGTVYGPFPLQEKQNFHPTIEDVPAGATYDLICAGSITMPSIDVSKTPDVVDGSTGTALFTVTLTNTGSITMTDVSTVDPLVADCDYMHVGPLAPGQAVTYTCMDNNVTSNYTNVITAAGSLQLVNVATAEITGTGNIATSNMVTDTITVIDVDDANVVTDPLQVGLAGMETATSISSLVVVVLATLILLTAVAVVTNRKLTS